MNNIELIRDILIRATGLNYYDTEQLARIVLDMINSDKLLIKILGRNIESLTMQMKAITQVTFERDNLKEKLEYSEAENLRLWQIIKELRDVTD